ncbi:hypothetical protein [Mycobacterium sp.]|uniref:hypothetical protein n=1 Tax=Mycobacterium sp. TaxID=1785 RepID=UPI0025D45AEF|nr:hypothetical protein [Mycobacterium sp.]
MTKLSSRSLRWFGGDWENNSAALSELQRALNDAPADLFDTDDIRAWRDHLSVIIEPA